MSEDTLERALDSAYLELTAAGFEWEAKALKRLRKRAKRSSELEAQLAAMRKAAVDYCWQRYKGRDPMNLKSPAVFTSHEWQAIGEAMDRAISALPQGGSGADYFEQYEERVKGWLTASDERQRKATRGEM